MIHEAINKTSSEQKFSDRFEYFFIEIPTWTVRYKIPEHLEQLYNSTYAGPRISEAIKPFDGWAICISESDHLPLLRRLDALLPDSIKSISGWSKTPSADELASTPTRQIAASEFIRIYGPDASSVNISEAARILGYDRKTLTRALMEANIRGSDKGANK